MKLSVAIVQRINELMKKQNKTAYKVYIESAVPKTTLYDTLSGVKKRVSVAMLYDICLSLEITLSEFFNSPLFDNIDD